jgi:hypothetical protein
MISMIGLSLYGCAHQKPINKGQASTSAEIILANQLLERIYSQESSPLECIADIDDASLLQRTLSPLLETAQDEFEASLDNDSTLNQLVTNCELECTCLYLNDLIKEHQVILQKETNKILLKKLKSKKTLECTKEFSENFCKSKLFEKLNQEKNQFTYEE